MIKNYKLALIGLIVSCSLSNAMNEPVIKKEKNIPKQWKCKYMEDGSIIHRYKLGKSNSFVIKGDNKVTQGKNGLEVISGILSIKLQFIDKIREAYLEYIESKSDLRGHRGFAWGFIQTFISTRIKTCLDKENKLVLSLISQKTQEALDFFKVRNDKISKPLLLTLCLPKGSTHKFKNINVSANFNLSNEHMKFDISGGQLNLTGSLSNGATLELKKGSTLNKEWNSK